MIRRFELVGDESKKYWQIDDQTGHCAYGRIGKSGGRANYARYAVAGKIREKLKKGYIEVTDADKDRVFQPGDLVTFRTDEPTHIKKWLGHSDEIKDVPTRCFGTVIDVESTVPEAPHWNVYKVLADSAIRTCAGVYMEPQQRIA